MRPKRLRRDIGCFFLLLLLSRLPASSTSAVFVITPNEIFAGIDRLTRLPGPDGTYTEKGVATKIALLKGRFVVACIGAEQYRQGPKHELAYDFPDWIKEVESRIPSTASVFQLVGVIEKESTRTFTETIPVESQMKDGELKYSDELNGFFVQYVVAGFDQGAPIVIEVNYRLDWTKDRLIGPTRNILPVRGANTGVYLGGKQDGFEKLNDPKSYAYIRMTALAPVAFKKIRFADPKISPAEAIQAVRAFIAVQAAVNPNSVGSGATVVSLPAVGRGSVTQYPKELTSALTGKIP
jgi:hypothetical protein